MRKAIIGTSAAALLVAASVATAPGASAASTWAGLRQCESGGNYSINTGNGFYGAYQFTLGTWAGLGYSGLPSSAPPAVQDAAAAKLFSQRGSEPWPVCGRGLRGGPAGAVIISASVSAPRPAPLVRLLQHDLNALDPALRLAEDGIQGPATWAARRNFAAWFHDSAGRPMPQDKVPFAVVFFAVVTR